MNLVGDDDVVVLARHNGRYDWYVSDRDYWVLDWDAWLRAYVDAVPVDLRYWGWGPFLWGTQDRPALRAAPTRAGTRVSGGATSPGAA